MNKNFYISRRSFLSRCSLAAAATGLPLWFVERQLSAAEAAGTVTSPNERPGVGLIGSRFRVPVVPVRIEGLDKVLHTHARWPHRGPVRIAFGAPLDLRGDDPAALARHVEEAVRRL